MKFISIHTTSVFEVQLNRLQIEFKMHHSQGGGYMIFAIFTFVTLCYMAIKPLQSMHENFDVD